jgi:hypothetical protein
LTNTSSPQDLIGTEPIIYSQSGSTVTRSPDPSDDEIMPNSSHREQNMELSIAESHGTGVLDSSNASVAIANNGQNIQMFWNNDVHSLINWSSEHLHPSTDTEPSGLYLGASHWGKSRLQEPGIGSSERTSSISESPAVSGGFPTTSSLGDQPYVSPTGNIAAREARSDAEGISPGGTAETGAYYLDSDGSRLPRVAKRRKTMSKDLTDASASSPFSQSARYGYGFPDARLSWNQEPPGLANKELRISEEIYHELRDWFYRTCSSSTHFMAFETTSFPSLTTLDHWISSFIENFLPLLPCIHLATFKPSKSHCLLLLAMAALGCRYPEDEDSSRCVTAMNEFLRRSILEMVSFFFLSGCHMLIKLLLSE